MNAESVAQQIRACFKELKFEEKRHIYTIDDEILPSVSKKISQFYEPFDKGIALLSTRKWNRENPNNKRSVSDTLAIWDKARDDSLLRGNDAHNYADQYPDFAEPVNELQKGILYWYHALPDNYIVVCTELAMFSSTFKYAGTADIILLNKDTGGLVIADWKTNQDLKKNYKKKRLQRPFAKLLDTPLNKYKIQLNSYKLIIDTETPYTVEDMWIIWLNENVNKVYHQQHEVPDMTDKLIKQYGA